MLLLRCLLLDDWWWLLDDWWWLLDDWWWLLCREPPPPPAAEEEGVSSLSLDSEERIPPPTFLSSIGE